MLQNENASLTRCQAELQKISEPLVESISRGAFSVPGGHSLYLEAKKKVEQDYEGVPRKGVKVRTGVGTAHRAWLDGLCSWESKTTAPPM